MPEGSSRLFQSVAERLISRWMTDQGFRDVRRSTAGERGDRRIDLNYVVDGTDVGVKLKADPYCGPDAAKAMDRGLPFYRPDQGQYALELIENAGARQPGWALSSEAEYLYYYFLALDHTETELEELHNRVDDALLPELRVTVDELVILPMPELRDWLELNADRYASRPVISPTGASWCRLIPRGDLEGSVAGIRVVGPLFSPNAH